MSHLVYQQFYPIHYRSSAARWEVLRYIIIIERYGLSVVLTTSSVGLLELVVKSYKRYYHFLCPTVFKNTSRCSAAIEQTAAPPHVQAALLRRSRDRHVQQKG